MTNITTAQALGVRIERLVQEHMTTTRVAAQAAMDRAFATSASVKAKKGTAGMAQTRRRRPTAELDSLGERLYAAMCSTPGETILVLAAAVGGAPRELHWPIALLKPAGRVRSVGQRRAMRYYPMASEGQPSP